MPEPEPEPVGFTHVVKTSGSVGTPRVLRQPLKPHGTLENPNPFCVLCAFCGFPAQARDVTRAKLRTNHNPFCALCAFCGLPARVAVAFPSGRGYRKARPRREGETHAAGDHRG